VLLLGEFAERPLIVVRDRVQLDPGCAEPGKRVAQLTELRPAGRSPDRGAVEDDDGLRPAATRVIVDHLSVRIRQGEVRKPLTDLRAGRVSVGESSACRVPERGGWVGPAGGP